MTLALFNHTSTSWHVARPGVDGDYAHTFGGDPAACGLRFTGNAVPLHLLYRLDLDDPRVGVRIPGVRWLPLCYGFGFNGLDTVYGVESDQQVKVIFPDGEPFNADHPFEDYPSSYPQAAIGFEQRRYDREEPEDVVLLSGVFGLAGISPETREGAIATLDKQGFFEEIDAYDMTKEEYLLDHCASPFIQGRPADECPNPECPQYEKPQSLKVFAIQRGEPMPGVALWGRFADVLLVFQICDTCKHIRVSNQCT